MAVTITQSEELTAEKVRETQQKTVILVSYCDRKKTRDYDLDNKRCLPEIPAMQVFLGQ